MSWFVCRSSSRSFSRVFSRSLGRAFRRLIGRVVSRAFTRLIGRSLRRIWSWFACGPLCRHSRGSGRAPGEWETNFVDRIRSSLRGPEQVTRHRIIGLIVACPWWLFSIRILRVSVSSYGSSGLCNTLSIISLCRYLTPAGSSTSRYLLSTRTWIVVRRSRRWWAFVPIPIPVSTTSFFITSVAVPVSFIPLIPYPVQITLVFPFHFLILLLFIIIIIVEKFLFTVIFVVEKFLFIIIFIVEKFLFAIVIFVVEKFLLAIIIFQASSLDIGEESISECVDVTSKCMDVANGGVKGLCLRLKGCQRRMDGGDDLFELSLGIPEVLGLLVNE